MKIDLTGRRFERLLVVKRGNDHISPSGKKSPSWVCKCDCENITTVNTTRLLNGQTKSCGCYRREVTTAKNVTHNSSKTKLYWVWKSMRERCRSKKCKHYKNYGGRGIDVCNDWLDFSVFKEWAVSNGYREGLSIERKDNDGWYSPDNCIWIPMSNQMRNRRSCVYLTYEGKVHTVSEWARIFGINHRSVLEFVSVHGKKEAIEYYVEKYGSKLSMKEEVNQ